ncbi:uncharacterized protein LOC106772423 isoform X1 [Vigna radiata var. radiata]|uniref:Uncharacterized protein LOC106772423 isoform X1 n=1 Tax=Vigna radiata var. radiata TaxID=3916 RepID=A0A3Q0F9K8_VIGRR|nr:uncharacterized protein LOC106772423 isoform X1 [Vigna radiata var. radiata]
MPPRAKKTTKASSSRTTPTIPEPVSPPLSPRVAGNDLFSSDEQYERFAAHFFERPILEGRYLSDEFMEPGKFEFFDVLTKAGLNEFVACRTHYYPELVRVFYSNMRISDSGVIRTEVKKVKITIKPSLFHKLTLIPSVGVPFEGTIVDDWKEEYNSITAKAFLCKEGENLQGRLTAGKLKFETRILHYVICRILLPCSTNVAQTIEEDILLLWALMNSIQINWGHLIRNRMKKETRDNGQLPYPHLITIFLEHFGVLSESDPFTQVKRRQRIGLQVLQTFGYHKNTEGIWVYKEPVRNVEDVQGNEEADEGDEEPEKTEQCPNPEQCSSGTFTEVIKEIQDLRMFVGERLERIENRVGVVEQELINLRNQAYQPPPT